MSTESQLVVRDRRSAAELEPVHAPVVLNQETVLLEVIAKAASASSAIDLERMERLMLMHERLQAKRAEQDFIDAMARFKANAPTILKTKQVSFGTTHYKHATLGDVCHAAIEGLAAVGISHRWDLDQSKPGVIGVTCVLTHTGSHSTSTTLAGAPDSSGQKNGIQQIASTVTYLQRYTLLAATGLATEDDNDGRAPKQQAAQQSTVPTKPQPFDNWWADTTAAADNGSAVLQKCWQAAPYGCRDYVNKMMPDDWQALKAKAVQADAVAAQ